MGKAEILLKNMNDTQKAAESLARTLRAGDVVCLHGDLGVGKTAFARALIQSLCGAQVEVPSPTFTLVQTYDAPYFPLWHFDLYRIEHPDEIFELGWEEALEGVSLVEWPDRLGHYKPHKAIDLTFEMVNLDERRLTIGRQE